MCSMRVMAFLMAILGSFSVFANQNIKSFGLPNVKIYTGPDVLYEDTEEHIDTGPESGQVPGPRALCTTPIVANGCCNYTIHDGYNNKDVNYEGPKTVFANEQAAETWAATQVARMPFFLPYNEDIALIQGWNYDNGGAHSALDFWRNTVTAGQDVTFKVLAVAPGRVVTKIWDDWFGNTVVIEHTASNGSKYRTIYMHLRNGYTHDLTAAQAVVPPDPNGNDNWAKYARYAKKYTSQLYWGTEAQTIAVNVGDWVQAGQFIASSGNTGAGGAGNGLNNDGSPADTTRANNHLHFMLSVPNPNTSGEWVFIDSFGVYNQVSTGCYALMRNIGFARFFAPYYPSFHNISWDLYKFYFSYYPNMNWGPQTLSLYGNNSQVLAAGAFDGTVTGSWALRGYLTTAEFSQWFTTYDQQGYRPRELQVLIASDGQPRFTAIWQKRNGESYYVWINMSDTDMQAKWNDLVVSKGYRVEDYVSYTVAGQRKHGAIFVKDGLGFQLWYGMTQAQYQQKFNDLWAAGWRTTSFNAADLPGGQRYASVWMQKPGAWATWFNLTSDQYQQKFDFYNNQGFRLWKVQGYSNGTGFGAIWTK